MQSSQPALRSSKRNYTSAPSALISLWFGRKGGRTGGTPGSHCTPLLSLPGGNDSLAFNTYNLPLSNNCANIVLLEAKSSRGGLGDQLHRLDRLSGSRVTPSVGMGQGGARLAHPLHGGFPETPGTWPEPPLSATNLPHRASPGLGCSPKVCKTRLREMCLSSVAQECCSCCTVPEDANVLLSSPQLREMYVTSWCWGGPS